MDYKIKYEEALKRAKYLKENTDSVGAKDTSASFEYIFPELKESEDEKIRKELIEFIRTLPCTISVKNEYFAWLEKQGEQKSVEWDYPYGENETVDKLMAIAECLEMDEDFMYNGYTGTECVKFLRDLARKQVECKPVDWNEKIKGLDELETYILSLDPNRSLDAIKVDAKNIRFLVNKDKNNE